MPEFREISGNSVRSLARSNQLARSLSSSDNTFETAKLIGKLKASSSPINIRAKGVVGKSDKVDIFKFKVQPGANFPSNMSNFNVTGGKIKYEVYWQHSDLSNGRIRLLGKATLKGSSSLFDDSNPTFNNTFDPITLYIRVSTKDKNVKYDLKTKYNPS